MKLQSQKLVNWSVNRYGVYGVISSVSTNHMPATGLFGTN